MGVAASFLVFSILQKLSSKSWLDENFDIVFNFLFVSHRVSPISKVFSNRLYKSDCPRSYHPILNTSSLASSAGTWVQDFQLMDSTLT